MNTVPKYIRIIIACTIAFGFSLLLYSRNYTTPSEVGIARIQEDVQSLITSLGSIQMPSMHFAYQTTVQISPTSQPLSSPPTQDIIQDQPQSPTSPPLHFTPIVSVPIKNTPLPLPTIKIVLPTAIKTVPTTLPKSPTLQPTKIPKPTKTPNEFPVDPALKRAGTTPDEVFTIAAQKTCVPKEVLRTIASIESGGFFSVVDPKWFKLYNSYNWWNSDYLEDPKLSPTYQRACSGYGYDNGSGLIEPDAKFAGMNCHKDGSTGTRSYILGPMQVSGLEQSKHGPKVASLLGIKNVDRRVILDAVTIVGVITQINVGASNCTNWTATQMVKAACGYYGSCGFKDGTYYCNTFCRNIKQYGGKDCSSAVSQFADDNCWK